MGVVSPFLRKVKTASGAMAVQIAVKEGRRDKVIEHLGWACQVVCVCGVGYRWGLIRSG